MSNRIPKKDMIQKFSETVGIEKAAQLIAEAMEQTGLTGSIEFNKTEALQILNALREKAGMIGIIAGFLASEVHLMED